MCVTKDWKIREVIQKIHRVFIIRQSGEYSFVEMNLRSFQCGGLPLYSMWSCQRNSGGWKEYSWVEVVKDCHPACFLRCYFNWRCIDVLINLGYSPFIYHFLPNFTQTYYETSYHILENLVVALFLLLRRVWMSKSWQEELPCQTWSKLLWRMLHFDENSGGTRSISFDITV